MNRPVSPQPSVLLQHQPQRYSDRHQLQPRTLAGGQSNGPCAARVPGGLPGVQNADGSQQSGKQVNKGYPLTAKKNETTNH